MKQNLSAIALCLLCITGYTGQSANLATSTTPALGLPSSNTSVNDIDLSRKFDDPLPVHLRGSPSGAIVMLTSCAEYKKVRKTVNGSDSELNYGTVKLEGARCDALSLLKQATPASRTAMPDGKFFTWRATSIYPGSLWAAFSDTEIARLSNQSATLKTASGKDSLKDVSEQFLEVENKTAGIHLTLMGFGDINHDEWQDAVVLVEGYAKGGSNTTARIVVLTRYNSENLLREIQIDDLLQ